MKKITFLVLTILATTTSFAQFDLFGVRAGMNISNLDYDSEVPSGNAHRNGFVVGFTAQYGITDKFSLAPEIQFSAEGAKKESLRLDYLNLPVFAKYAITEQLSVGLGPQLGLKVHEYEDGFNNLMFSGVAGVEYVFFDDFYVDVRYVYGVTNVYDDEQVLEAKNSNIQIGLGIKIF
ncbi:PorT family protein [Formosa sediminum]|uniref:PorT family protein n=1 Tax=Formosa sediminum TaxID=2594004 RepID=A0A516GVL7_9FLAO|nr:porin family protein [Formosa sediminum]QDO95567.1 PorT family protein [Formosa sediminum]